MCQHMGMAVALARGALERADLKTSQPAKPGVGDPRLHAGRMQLIDAGVQELDWRVDAGAKETARRGFGDAGQIGELQPAERRDQDGVIDALEAVALVLVCGLRCHTARGCDAGSAPAGLVELFSESR